MLSRIAIASLAFVSAGLVASRVQSQFVQALAFSGKSTPQYGQGIVPGGETGAASVGASVYSITIQTPNSRQLRQAFAARFSTPHAFAVHSAPLSSVTGEVAVTRIQIRFWVCRRALAKR